MASRQDTMMNPSIEELLDRAGSKFSLVTLSAMRARQINAYFNQLGEGLGAIVPPQVTSVARKPLSIAFEEIAGDKIVLAHPSEAPDESEAAVAVEAVAEADPSGDGSESDGAE
jgi:DNA-directed RNA polymerase subunit omega